MIKIRQDDLKGYAHDIVLISDSLKTDYRCVTH